MKKNIQLILSYMLIFGCHLFSQYSIKGYIKGDNNEPLSGVIIHIPSVNKNTISTTDGYFEINNLYNGFYVLEFKLLGYKTLSKKINIEDKDIILDINLLPSAREMDEVIITTAADILQQKENPMPVKTINFDDINKQANNNIIEAISKKDNVWNLSTGPGIAKPIIRGLGQNRSVVLVNSLRQEGQQWGDEHGVEIDQYSIQKAEIIKGPGSIMYGSDALAGIINFIPYRIYRDGWGGKYLGLYQSNNQMIANSAMIQYKKNNTDFYIQFTQKDAGNYQNSKDGKVFNTGFNERNFSANFHTGKKRWHSDFYASVFTQKLNMPEGDRDSAGRFLRFTAINDSTIGQVVVTNDELNGYKFFIPYQQIKHYRFQNHSVVSLNSKDKLVTNIGYQYNIRDEYGPHKLIESHHQHHQHSHHQHTHSGHEEEHKHEHGELSMHLHTIPYQIKYIKTFDSSQTISTGATGMFQLNLNKGEELLIPDYDLFDAGVFTYYQKSIKKWTIAGGIRWDIRKINAEEMYVDSSGSRIETFEGNPSNAVLKFTNFSKQYNNISATLGWVYNGWRDVNLKFNIARGFRTPNISELLSNGGHEGTTRYEYGNLNLKPEVSYQADVGLLINKEHVLFEITPFANYITNYIYLRKLSSLLGGDSLIQKDQETLWAFTYNQAQALIYGGEASIDIHPHPLDWLHFESNYSYLKGQTLNQPDSLSNLPFFPPSRWSNEIRAEWNNLNTTIRNLFLKFETVYVFPQNNFFKAYNTETYTPDYTLINVSAGIGLKYWKERQLHIIAGVNNILDHAYQDHLNRLKYVRPSPITGKGLYNMGRNLFIRLIVNF